MRVIDGESVHRLLDYGLWSRRWPQRIARRRR